jgi:hypothetical protein
MENKKNMMLDLFLVILRDNTKVYRRELCFLLDLDAKPVTKNTTETKETGLEPGLFERQQKVTLKPSACVFNMNKLLANVNDLA